MIDRVLRLDGFRGILAFTLPEAIWLARHGTSDDIVVAYPTASRAALAELAGDPALAAVVTVMIDCPAHLDMIEKAAAGLPDPHQVRVCIDLDAGYVALGGRLRAGARRSPVRTPEQAAALARDAAGRPDQAGRADGDESQIAGVGDDPPGRHCMAQPFGICNASRRRNWRYGGPPS